ncbi:hypothetical protein JCM16303_005003 [Sporobolomyces ruberrimus]
MSSYLKPLLPFSSSSSPSSSNSSSSTLSTPYTSLHSSPSLSHKLYPPNTSLSSRNKGFFPPFPPKKLWLPLLLLGCASYAFIANFRSLVPRTYSIDDELSVQGGGGSLNQKNAKEAETSLNARWLKSTQPLPLSTSALARLTEWENTLPEIEPGEWVAKNLETCPDSRIRPNQNGQMLDKSHLVWASMSRKKVLGMRKEMGDYLRGKIEEGALEDYGSGRGLVFTAGNADTFSRVRTTLKLLHNHLHSPLASEIFSFPSEQPPESLRIELETHYNATFRTVSTASKDSKRTKNYHLKATAIVRSRFREVLYLDSDNLPTAGLGGVGDEVPESVMEEAKMENRTENPWVRGNGEEVWGKPSGIWESKGYERLKVMFWPDYWRTSADNSIWSIIGVPCRDEWEQEAGQIIVDKKYHLDALLLAEWMMDSSRFKYWFNFSDGDKDMFRFAFLALRKRWAVPGRYVSVGALPSNTMTGFCGTTMLQHDHLGKPLFVHANLLKQIPSGIGKGFAWGRSRQIRTQPSTLTIPTKYERSSTLEAEDPLTDDDIDCDMLANASDDGIALAPVPEGSKGYRIRRRAVMEKGIRAFFHGGMWSAFCIDYKYEDPRTEEQVQEAKMSVARNMLSSTHEGNKSLEEVAKDVDVCYCAANDAFETRLCGEDLTEVVQWKDDPRLRGFEEAFFQEGGVLNGQGF